MLEDAEAAAAAVVVVVAVAVDDIAAVLLLMRGRAAEMCVRTVVGVRRGVPSAIVNLRKTCALKDCKCWRVPKARVDDRSRGSSVLGLVMMGKEDREEALLYL